MTEIIIHRAEWERCLLLNEKKRASRFKKRIIMENGVCSKSMARETRLIG